MTKPNANPRSYRLTNEALEMLGELSETNGLTATKQLETLIRTEHRRHKKRVQREQRAVALQHDPG